VLEPAPRADDIDDLVRLVRGKRVVALTGAGCSTDSGIPDYRGPTAKPHRPMQHREFVDRADARRRYWARSMIGWPWFAAAKPNRAHHALAALERTGIVAGVITQNVDGLHARAGSRDVIELHGALARVICLGCGALSSRDELQARLVEANPGFALVEPAAFAPDGDAIVDDDAIAVIACGCGGILMPDVVFFGGSVPRARLDSAWAMLDRAEVLVVAGSSLTVYSGYRFVKRAAERGIPIAIVNRGGTRGDPHATLKVEAGVAEVFDRVVDELG
jgi:NAD-dependent SIR2 family protein deacetylase